MLDYYTLINPLIKSYYSKVNLNGYNLTFWTIHGPYSACYCLNHAAQIFVSPLFFHLRTFIIL